VCAIYVLKRSLAYYNVDGGIANVNMYVLMFVPYCFSV